MKRVITLFYCAIVIHILMMLSNDWATLFYYSFIVLSFIITHTLVSILLFIACNCSHYFIMTSFLLVKICNSMTIGDISTLTCCSSICIPMPILASIELCSTRLSGCACLFWICYVSLGLFYVFVVGSYPCCSNWMHKIDVVTHCLCPILKYYCYCLCWIEPMILLSLITLLT